MSQFLPVLPLFFSLSKVFAELFYPFFARDREILKSSEIKNWRDPAGDLPAFVELSGKGVQGNQLILWIEAVHDPKHLSPLFTPERGCRKPRVSGFFGDKNIEAVLCVQCLHQAYCTPLRTVRPEAVFLLTGATKTMGSVTVETPVGRGFFFLLHI